MLVGYDYFSTLQVDMIDGRAFSKDFASDSASIILNEAAIRETGIVDPVDMEFRLLQRDSSYTRLKIIGVAKDYHFRSLHTDIEPQLMIFDPSACK